MKTTMQELLEHLVNEWSSPSDCWNPSKVIDKVESMIEKEKEQIIDFGYKCRDNQKKLPQDIFNQTYKQETI